MTLLTARLQPLVAAGVAVLTMASCTSEGRPEAADPRPGRSVQAPTTTSEPITLAFAGDVHFEAALAAVPGRPGSTLGPMSAVLREADLATVNLETALTTRDDPAPKELEQPGNRYWFRAPPRALDVLDRSGVDVVSVANNHGADHGVAGLRDTVRAAASSEVAVIGVGADERAAFTPYRTTIRGTDVAVLAADASARESADATWAVSAGSGPGLASARGDAAQLVAAVRESALVDDLVVVYLHWGEEGDTCSTGSQQALARTLSEAGADIVVGTHAHVSVGAGTLGDTYVSYGLGNFFWYHGVTSETGVLTLTVEGDRVVDDTWTPAQIRPGGGNPQPLRGAAAQDAVSDWRSLRGCTDLAAGPGAVAPDDGLPDFSADVAALEATQRQRIRASSPAACPVPLTDLRHLSLSYVGFDGAAHVGELVVHRSVADDVVLVMAALYDARFPIEQMRPVDVYDGDDGRSMAANNTSAYNCRRVAGTTTWSDHAYGRAIDINPVQNPYVLQGRAQPPSGRAYVDADRGRAAGGRPGVVRDGDVVRRAFDRVGWSWGGDYSEPDFQHFSA